MVEKKFISLGKRGELIAKRFLERTGYDIIATNIKLGNLEIDLTASHQGWLYFFEIKTKSVNQIKQTDSLISKKQLSNLKRAAHIYAARNQVGWEKIKFDLLVVYIDDLLKKATIKRHHDIFS